MNFRQNNMTRLTILALGLIIINATAVAGDAAAGKTVYDGKGACATCHGATGAGDGIAAAALNPKPASFVTAEFRLDTDGDGKAGTDTDLTNVIIYGGSKYGGNVAMPGRADLTAAEVSDLVAYMHSLKQ